MKITALALAILGLASHMATASPAPKKKPPVTVVLPDPNTVHHDKSPEFCGVREPVYSICRGGKDQYCKLEGKHYRCEYGRCSNECESKCGAYKAWDAAHELHVFMGVTCA
ncbi:hypothetical protein KVT40_007304 [Elsinoe batatas]|uniref:Uncharacterized protein n=1 Tax=Elsinoe batatas TaxID=2601811 RepID=A0A8K0KVE1_9PEZI|nr:hypothetical protein KVT40_007304 [Elsinoe batatas]